MSGNFVIADRKKYAAAADLNDYFPQITELWAKSVPIEQRISEMEAGVIPDVLEVSREPKEIINFSYRLVKAAREEILIIFHTSNALLRQESNLGNIILWHKLS